MIQGLTARQTQILKVLIDEYVEKATPVGSEILEKKYNLGVSSATIRNEMVKLTSLGYLKQPHTSAGRIPTPKAMRFYIDQLMEEKKMSLTDEVKAKEEVWDVRKDLNALMEEAVHSLATRTGNLAVAMVDDEGRIWHSGYANIFANPEFSDLELCANLFSLLEEVNSLHDIFFERANDSSEVRVIFGEELGWRTLSPIGFAATQFRVMRKNAALGVIGPARVSPTVIPILRYFSQLIQEVSQEQ